MPVKSGINDAEIKLTTARRTKFCAAALLQIVADETVRRFTE
ncbi:MAG: hypothetical protein WB760_18915 [Xanthobacteraceae bacterium]